MAGAQTGAELRYKLLDLEKPLFTMIYGYCLGAGSAWR
jgi:hypothetical protein